MALLATLGGLLWLWQQRGGVASGPVGTSPAPTAASPRVPPGTSAGILDRSVVYLARDLLPPYALHVDGADAGATPGERIRSRIEALKRVPAVGPGAPGQAGQLANPAALVKPRLAKVTVQGDLVTLDYDVPGDGWGTAGSAATRAFVQQLVYTASEEPGIRRVLITQNGGRQAIIGGEGLVVDRPATREDVAGYDAKAEAELRSDGAKPHAPVNVTTRWSVDEVAPGLARFVVELGPGAPELPDLAATYARNDDEVGDPDRAKWVLRLALPGVRASGVGPQPTPATGASATRRTERVDRTPLRAVHTIVDPTWDGVVFELALDDARPWRVGYVPNPTRLVVDVGGHPLAVARNTAVYAPRPGATVDRTFTVNGLARAFEANVPWRVRDGAGRVIARGFTTATIGTSVVWGAYEISATLPETARGQVTLEVFQVSAKDGSETEIVRVPLSVR